MAEYIPFITLNPFNYGTQVGGELRAQTFVKREIPLIVRSVPKPELIIWENMDFVNKPLPATSWLIRSGGFWLALLLLTTLSCMFTWTAVRYQPETQVTAAQCRNLISNTISAYDSPTSVQQLCLCPELRIMDQILFDWEVSRRPP